MLTDLIARKGCFAGLARQFLQGQLLGKNECEDRSGTTCFSRSLEPLTIFLEKLNHEDLLNLARRFWSVRYVDAA